MQGIMQILPLHFQVLSVFEAKRPLALALVLVKSFRDTSSFQVGHNWSTRLVVPATKLSGTCGYLARTVTNSTMAPLPFPLPLVAIFPLPLLLPLLLPF